MIKRRMRTAEEHFLRLGVSNRAGFVKQHTVMAELSSLCDCVHDGFTFAG